MKLSLFDALEQVETLLSNLYARYSEISGYPPEIAQLFARMSGEEMSHRDLVRFQRRLVFKNPSMIENVELKADDLNGMVDEIKLELQSRDNPPFKDALTKAVRFEVESAECHFRDALSFGNKGMSEMMTKLGKADRTHKEILVDVASKHGVIIDLEDEA